MRQHPVHLSSGHWCPAWPWSQLLWKNKVTVFLWTWVVIKTQRKITLTENQSSSEVTKRRTWEKKMAHIFPMQTAKKYQKYGSVHSSSYLSYQELIYSHKLHFQSVGCTEYTVEETKTETLLWTLLEKSYFNVNIVSNMSMNRSLSILYKARSCKSSRFYFSNVPLFTSNVFGHRLKVSLWSNKDLKKSSSPISRTDNSLFEVWPIQWMWFLT